MFRGQPARIAGFLHQLVLNSRLLNGNCARLLNRERNNRAEGMKMSIPNETLKAMIRDYNGLELSDEELELVRPELESYFVELKKLEDLDLSDVLSGRLLKIAD